ncbi:MAG: phosphomannomutase/phosphoglucomutase [Pseudomonadales bacterium]|nr:phosphomannomutase/phosphoglucomutase [Pseudomonadales bacterium]
MKLSKKKNDPVASQLADNEASIIEGSGGIGQGFMVAALGLFVGLCCALGIAYFQVVGVEQNQRTILAEGYAKHYSSLLNQSIHQMRAQQKQLASNLEIRSAVIGRDSVTQRILADSLGEKIPHLVRLELYSEGMAQIDQKPVAPVGHAALQMIVWAEQDQEVEAEIHKTSGGPLVYTIEPVLGQDNKPAGVLLMVFALAMLEQPLASLDEAKGRARLIQQFPSMAAQEIFTVGLGQRAIDSEVVKVPLSNSRWVLEFSAAPALFKGHGFPLQYVAIAYVIWLLVALMALFIGYRIISKKLNQNARELFRYMSNTVRASNGERYQFSLDMFESLSKGFAHLMKESPGRQQAQDTKPKQPAITEPAMQNVEVAAEVDKTPAQIYSGIEEAQVEELNISPELFRAYDIRGVVEQSLTVEAVELIGQAIGSEVIDQGERQVVVAADGRLSSPALKEVLIKGLTSTGCNVVDIGVTPTPVLYFALHHLGHTSGVMITGSHNPADYNGLKIVIDGVTISEDRIQKLYHRVMAGDVVSGVGQVESVNVSNKYLDRICNDVALIADPIKLVVDCGNGVTGKVAPTLLKALGCEVIELYCDVDGSFPNHPPDPGKGENLKDLIARVSAEGADLGLAFDGDGDRLVAVTGSGIIVQPDRLMMLFVQDIISRNPGADVVFDVKCSKHLAEVISEAGGRPVMWKSGHSLMKAKADELGALIAGEFSGHLFFRERWYGFDDGIYSAARLLEVLSTEGLTLDELMSELPWSPSTPELEIDMDDDQKFVFMEKFRENAQFEGGSLTDLDGVRIDFSDGWGLVRASNTMPKLTLRFEADDEPSLTRIQGLFKQQLLAIDGELSIPF